jgi:hypothetical protein
MPSWPGVAHGLLIRSKNYRPLEHVGRSRRFSIETGSIELGRIKSLSLLLVWSYFAAATKFVENTLHQYSFSRVK